MTIGTSFPADQTLTKIGRDAQALFVKNPPMGEEGGREKYGIERTHKAQVQQRRWDSAGLGDRRRDTSEAIQNPSRAPSRLGEAARSINRTG